MRTVTAAARSLDVLELFLTRPGPLTMTEIAAGVDIPRSTLHEIAHTLRARGYLQTDGDGLALGLRLFELGNVYRARLDLAVLGREEACELVRATGETAQVAIRDATDVVYIARQDGSHHLRLVSEVGRRLPATCTGVGKAMLAGLTDAEIAELYPHDSAFVRMTPHSIRSRAALVEELARTRARGYALDDCESNAAVRCVAAAVHDAAGTPVAAVSVSIPTVRWSPRTEPRVSGLVRRSGARLSARLGSTASSRP